MLDMTIDSSLIFICLLSAVLLLQTIFTVSLLIALRISSRDNQKMNRETYGLLRKIDVLTSQQRESMLQHYDKILEQMTVRLPASIAAQAGDTIFQTESQLLARLAELEPQIGKDEKAQESMNRLIRSMENLEAQIVTITADTVQNVMAESRRDLFKDDFPFIPDSMRQLNQ